MDIGGSGRGGEVSREIADAARSGEPDRYLSALLAPRAVRGDLVLLAAFLAEIGRIPVLVSDPMRGEFRLQWWRDAIPGFGSGARTGHPLADAVGEMAARHGLSAAALLGPVEACSIELYDTPATGANALARYLDGRDGAGFRLAAQILGADQGAHAGEMITAAGEAYGLVRILRTLPRRQALGRLLLPMGGLSTPSSGGSDASWEAGPAAHAAVVAGAAALARARLADIRARQRSLQRGLNAAILPCALVEPYLRALERYGHDDPARLAADITPMTRVWRLWRAHRRGWV